MTLRTILEFPDPRLRTKAKEVKKVTSSTRTLVKDMLETMYDSNGIGLAATQINVHERIIVMDLSENRDEPLVLINPSFEILDEQLHQYDEGCLSVPGFYESVERPQKIKVHALNEKGKAFDFEAEELLAVCVQHEIDHLDGKLFVDYLSNLKRDRIRKKLQKLQRVNK